MGATMVSCWNDRPPIDPLPPRTQPSSGMGLPVVAADVLAGEDDAENAANEEERRKRKGDDRDHLRHGDPVLVAAIGVHKVLPK